jgi:hypothetical protein
LPDNNQDIIRRGKESRQALIVCLIVLACLLFYTLATSVAYENEEKLTGVHKKNALYDTSHIPLQSNLPTADPITINRPDYTWRMYPRAGYQIAARVLQTMHYQDWQADFSPVDLALGWGIMGNPAVDRWVEVRQEDRWYFYSKQKDAPITMEDIRSSSANVHVIPATEELAAVLQQLRPNDIVLMEGILVDVEVDKSGEQIEFQTSLTRFDTEDNSCEIFYVERLIFNAREYK